MEHFIKNIEITNFKSIRHAEVKDCRRVNVFVGYPNVGKSNILEALSGFSFLSKSNLPSLDSLVRFENLPEIFFNGNTKKDSEISINNQIDLRYHYISTRNLEVSMSNRVSDKRDTMDYSTNNIIYFSAYYKDSRFSFDNSSPVLKEKSFLKKYEYLNKTDYLSSEDNTLVVPFGNNLKDVITSDSLISESVHELFSGTNMNLAYDKSENDLKVLKFLYNKFILTLPFSSIADTLRRLIFYRVAILSNKNTTLLFEEPESHMFPPYISKMTGDITYDQNNNQFFIATHSPYVLGDLIRDVEPEELSVYIVGYDAGKGETIIYRMNEEEVNEAYQFGHDFFMNIDTFIPKEHEQV